MQREISQASGAGQGKDRPPRQIVSAGQASGELRQDRTGNDIVKAYALWERALLYDWCICNGEYSLREYAGKLMPMFLQSIRAE